MKLRSLALLALSGSLMLTSCQSESGNPIVFKTIDVTYPQTEEKPVVDEYFGTEVSDPYRWLEDDLSAETADWVRAENEVTFMLNQYDGAKSK